MPEQEPNPIAEAFDDTIIPTPERNEFLDQFDDIQPPASEETPPAAEEAPPAATDDAADDADGFPDEPPGQVTESSGKVWKNIKTELKKTKADLRLERDTKAQELAARDTELTQLREIAAKLPDLEQKATFVEEAEKKIAILDVRQSTEYQNTINKPLEAIGKSIDVIAEANQIKVHDLEDAIAESDPVKRRELLRAVMADMEDMDKREVMEMVRDTQAIFAKKADMEARAYEAKKELEAQGAFRIKPAINQKIIFDQDGFFLTIHHRVVRSKI